MAIPWRSGPPWRVADKILTLTEDEWLRCLKRFLRDRDHHISDHQATVTTPSGTLVLSWQQHPPRRLGSLQLPTLQLSMTDDLPATESQEIHQALDLATRKGGG